MIAEMSALTPCSTRRLLDILLRKELLMVQHCQAKKSCPLGFLRAAPTEASMVRLLLSCTQFANALPHSPSRVPSRSNKDACRSLKCELETPASR